MRRRITATIVALILFAGGLGVVANLSPDEDAHGTTYWQSCKIVTLWGGSKWMDCLQAKFLRDPYTGKHVDHHFHRVIYPI